MNSNYDALSGGVSAWGLGGMGAVRRGGFGSSGSLGGVSASSFADGQADPNGFHWEFITDDTDGSRITNDVTGQPIVDIVAN